MLFPWFRAAETIGFRHAEKDLRFSWRKAASVALLAERPEP
jgi:hypothetical protein